LLVTLLQILEAGPPIAMFRGKRLQGIFPAGCSQMTRSDGESTLRVRPDDFRRMLVAAGVSLVDGDDRPGYRFSGAIDHPSAECRSLGEGKIQGALCAVPQRQFSVVRLGIEKVRSRRGDQIITRRNLSKHKAPVGPR